ncbi:MAG: hypothetical protein CVU41_16255 [Chloroflexi bacterium HGW-Chloroflexi-3]|nr:MAG: hypothetical protein CVU41_16255 [Chloroflexi bacterium HGW-Chloroflexi-3]
MSNKVSVPLTNNEYNVLKNNYIISACCKRQLNTVTLSKSGAELLLTLNELKELIGYIATEANHALTKRKKEELNSICDYLESIDNI